MACYGPGGSCWDRIWYKIPAAAPTKKCLSRLRRWRAIERQTARLQFRGAVELSRCSRVMSCLIQVRNSAEWLNMKEVFKPANQPASQYDT